jgi:mRNA interferase RelE/StbE
MNISLSTRAEKDLERLDKGLKKRIKDTLDRMTVNPGSVDFKKLQGEENLWRVRIGNLRIILEINWKEKQAEVLHILGRKDAYKR